MQHIETDNCSLPEDGGFRHLFICINYLSKWSEAKLTKDKSASTIAQLLYEFICWN